MYSPKLQYRFRFSRHSFSARYTIAYSQRIHSVMGNIEAISTILVLTKSFRNIDELWKTYQQNESSIWHFSRIKLYRQVSVKTNSSEECFCHLYAFGHKTDSVGYEEGSTPQPYKLRAVNPPKTQQSLGLGDGKRGIRRQQLFPVKTLWCQDR